MAMSPPRMEEGFRPGGLPVPPPSEEVPTFIVFMNVINTVTHLLIGGVAVASFICINMFSYYTMNLFPQLSAHVYLTLIGYGFLLSQAILSLKPEKGWENNFMYPQKTKVYWCLQVIGSTVAVIGCGLGIAGSERFNSYFEVGHLVTRHQIMGFIVMLCTFASLAGGVIPLVAFNRVNTSFYKTIYAGISTVTLILAYVVIILGIVQFREIIFPASANLAISFSVLALVGLLTMWIANYLVAGKFAI